MNVVNGTPAEDWAPAPPASEPPALGGLRTRCLEGHRVVRTYVRRAEVRELLPTGVVLTTHDAVSTRMTTFAPSTELPANGDTISGTMRVELVGEGTLRVRYAQAGDVPENPTAMVIGSASAPIHPPVVAAADSAVTIARGNTTIEIQLEPLAISVLVDYGAEPIGEVTRQAQHNDSRRRSRRAETSCRDTGAYPRNSYVEVAFLGGREKNFWNLWDSYNTGICRTGNGDPLAVETFALRPSEAVFGFGEQFLKLNKVGQTIDLNMVEATGTSTPRAYKNIPLFLTTGGYGVFFNHSSRITAWVGSMAAADVQVALEDDFLDYYVLLGDLATILSRYTDLTGKPAVPPRWSFGFWQSKISYRSADEALDVVQHMRESRLPVDVIHLDTHWFKQDWYCDLEFDRTRFPDPKAFMAALHELGVHVSLWQLPYIPEGSDLFDELVEVDGFVKRADGTLYDVGICYTPGFRGQVGCIDFTNPAAREVHQRHLRRLHELGADVIKVDFGEQAPLDGVYFDGTPGHRAHNLYPLLYNTSVAEATKAATGESIIWARSAWAGSQRYPLHWGGDSSATWRGLGPQFEGGLSLGLSGFSFWSQDIGGFLGPTGGDLLVRWMQAGLFQSHARIHGMGDRELYKFPADVVDIYRRYLDLRYRLLPYLWSTAVESAARSRPMARALVLEFQNDPTTWSIGDQWMLGDSLLVAPVFSPDGHRRAYLPPGTWTDWWTGELIDGGDG